MAQHKKFQILFPLSGLRKKHFAHISDVSTDTLRKAIQGKTISKTYLTSIIHAFNSECSERDIRLEGLPLAVSEIEE